MSIQEYQLVINMLLNADIGKLSHANNNRVERLNGTPKGSKCSENARNTPSLFAEGQRIKYSFETIYGFRK
jgi:hypothetical protein